MKYRMLLIFPLLILSMSCEKKNIINKTGIDSSNNSREEYMDPLSSFRGIAFNPCNEKTLGTIVETIIKPKEELKMQISLRKPNSKMKLVYERGLFKKLYTYEITSANLEELKTQLNNEYSNIAEISFNIGNEITIKMRKMDRVVQEYNGGYIPTIEIDFSGEKNEIKNEILKVVQNNFKESSITPGITVIK